MIYMYCKVIKVEKQSQNTKTNVLKTKKHFNFSINLISLIVYSELHNKLCKKLQVIKLKSI